MTLAMSRGDLEAALEVAMVLPVAWDQYHKNVHQRQSRSVLVQNPDEPFQMYHVVIKPKQLQKSVVKRPRSQKLHHSFSQLKDLKSRKKYNICIKYVDKHSTNGGIFLLNPLSRLTIKWNNTCEKPLTTKQIASVPMILHSMHKWNRVKSPQGDSFALFTGSS